LLRSAELSNPWRFGPNGEIEEEKIVVKVLVINNLREGEKIITTQEILWGHYILSVDFLSR